MIDLQVPTNLVMKRLASRRVCVDCGANYSTAAPPLVNWTCDVCGGEVVQREDDTEEAIERRLNLYEEETAPLLDWYKERSLLAEINGTGSPDAVTRRVVGAIDVLRQKLQGEGGAVRRNDDELAKMRRAGKVVAEMHEATRAAAKPGVTTADLDAVAREVLERRGATSNFLGYHGFPAVICTSPNSMIVHGIPGGYVLEEGDILSIDCGAIIEGYHGDAAFTMGIGTISKEAQKLLEVTERSLWAGIEQMTRGNSLHEIGRAVQDVAEAAGFSVVREYVGHAIGTAMHEQPQVPNYWPGTKGPTLKTGNVFAVEPMVNVGSPETVLLDDELERGDGRREPLGPFRAHDRRDPRRPGGLHPALRAPIPGPARAFANSGWKTPQDAVNLFAGFGPGLFPWGRTDRWPHPIPLRSGLAPPVRSGQDTKPTQESVTCPSPRKMPSCSKARWSSHCPTPCSASSWRTDTRCWRTARARCGCTASASFRGTRCRWRSLRTTSTGVGSPIGTSKKDGDSSEGSAEREADL